MPKGQKVRPDFPRFGLPKFAYRLPNPDHDQSIAVQITPNDSFDVTFKQIGSYPNVSLTADFHCVTTWSVCDLTWRGLPFKTFFEDFIEPRLGNTKSPEYLVFHGHDGYRACLPLVSALSDRVILAAELLN